MMSRTLVVVVSILTLSCGGKSPAGPTGPDASNRPTTFAGYVSQAVTLAAVPTTSVTRTGAPPATAGGPTANIISPAPASSGGANLLTVLGSAPF